MDGVHDMGGRQGFGRVRYALEAPAFHEPWERRVNALYSHGGQARHLQHGRVPPRHRAHGAAPLSLRQLLRALADQPRDALRREGHRHPGGAGDAGAGGFFPLSEPSAPGRTNLPRAASASSRATGCACRTSFFPGHVRMPGYIRGKTGVVVSESPRLSLPRRACARHRGGGRADLRRRASAPRTCGPTRLIRRWCMSACSRATSNATADAALGGRGCPRPPRAASGQFGAQDPRRRRPGSRPPASPRPSHASCNRNRG